MSDFEYNTGYFYPLSDEEYQILNDVDFFGNDIVQTPFCLEWFGHNKYLVLSQTHSYGIENHEFGNSRPLTDNESKLVPMKFSNEFTKIKFQASKFKFVEYCYYNSVDCKDYYLESSKPKQSETMTLEQAIEEMHDFAKETPMFVGSPKAAKIAEWLQELAAFKDETPITEKWLQDNGISASGWMKIGDNVIRWYETGRARWCASVDNDDRYFHEKFRYIKSLGQLRMFLTLCGLGDFAKQLKS